MKVNVKNAVKFITDPKTAGVAAFVGVGAVKAVSDYKKAEPHEKRKTLAYDTAVIAGTALAYTAFRPLTNFLCNTRFVDSVAKIFSRTSCFGIKASFFKNLFNPSSKKMHKVLDSTKKTILFSLEATENIFKECFASVLNTFFGFIGAIYSSALMKKFVLNKPFFNPKEPENQIDEKPSEIIKITILGLTH